MNWIDSIKEIQRMADENRLVVFVGSGVSANSGIPTWGKLIEQFAKELSYNKCGQCEEYVENCANIGCHKKYNFNRDEYLRIPEYYYNQQREDKYHKFIQETLACEQNANSINDAIFRIMPHHIITTNYDRLLETSKEANAHLYTLVSKDDDILSNNNFRYIIKMHGDIEHPKTIVLKESDYINYEQTHVLISTFIKSLLIDHSFLFIGYSLNDYNLNLIIGWINYFVRASNIDNRPNNFIIQAEPASEFEAVRLERSSISVISTNEMPNNVLEKFVLPEDITDERGKMLYAYLKCIYDSELLNNFISLSDALYAKCDTLQSYNKISHEDLLNSFPQRAAGVKAQTLCFYDEDLYSQMEEIINENTDASNLITNTLQKACIDGLFHYGLDGAGISISKLHSDEDELMQLYLDNKYFDLITRLQAFTNPLIKAYYYNLLRTNISDINGLMEEVERSIVSGDYISILMYKINCRLLKISPFERDIDGTREIERIFEALPRKFVSATTYISKLFRSLDINHKIMEELLQKHEERFSYDNSSVSTAHSFDKLWDIQAYAYDYYFFVKKNYLLLDYFSDIKNYLSYYLRAVFCTYSPLKVTSEEFFIGFDTHLEQYVLGEIEVDMIVKYAQPKDLLNWVKKYKVAKIKVSVNVVEKFVSYCESFVTLGATWVDQLHCFTILLSKMQFDLDDSSKISLAFVDLVENLAQDSAIRVSNIFSAINLFVSDLMISTQKNINQKLLTVLLVPDILSAIIERHSHDYQRLLTTFVPYVSMKNKKHLYNEIEAINSANLKCRYIYTVRKVISKQRYKSFLKENLAVINCEQLFNFVIEGYISYDEEVLIRFLSIIESVIADRKRTGARSYPDWMKMSLEYCILLKILGKPVDISRLDAYKEYSDHLAFLLSPNDFDYSKVDTSNYMWSNFFRREEYFTHLYNHRSEILTDDLEKLFANGFASMDQQKIVYGHLLENKEIWKYARD